MPVPDWTAAFTLTTTAGNLDLFDGSTIDGLVPIPEQCDVGADLRVNTENLPQGDGSLFHRRYKRGMVMRYTAGLYDGGAIATGSARSDALDDLRLHLNALQNGDGRIVWAIPGGGGDRMLDRIRLLERVQYQGGLLKTISFVVESPFPYALTEAEQEISTLEDGVPATITNGGSADTYPVWKLNGPTSGTVTIENTTTGLQIVYSDSLPGAVAIGGGDYVEIDTFRNTAYLNGDEANRKPGIDLLLSDFFPLVPGDNEITVTGATCDALVNDAWA